MNENLSEYCAALRDKYPLNNKVLFIQAPQFMPDSFNIKVARQRGCYAYPPTGLQCLSRALSDRGLEINILDLNYEVLKRVITDDSFNYLDWLSILDEYLGSFNASIVGVSCISIYTDVFEPTHPLTAILKHLREKDRSVLVAGGCIATNEHDGYLEKDLCHFVVDGEGENKINYLFDNLIGSDKARKHMATPGIYFKFDGKIEKTGGGEDKVDLKGTLIETYEDMPIEDYCNVGSLNPFSRMAGLNRPFSVMQLNRGCRANCRFCGVIEFMGKGLRRYPVRDVLEEIDYQIIEKGIRHFEVLDDDFLAQEGRESSVIKLLEAMANRRAKYGITWAAGNGLIAASLDENVLSLMRDSGCVGFRIGIESGNERILKRMRKPVTLQLLRKTAKMLRRYPEFFVGGNFIIGSFGEETFGEMIDTYNFAIELGLDWSAFTTFQFTSKARIVTENMDTKGKQAADFIPAKDVSDREITQAPEIVSGPGIFNIDKNTVPSQEQIRQIWFTFNLLANYIHNKNLSPGGRPEKFVSWINAVRVAYPDNPYMALFAGIAHAMTLDGASAGKSLEETKAKLKNSSYWRGRFEEFGLFELIDNFPADRAGAYRLLESARKKYKEHLYARV